jgi:uncharacterized protein YndB with AHSA1/START domain
MSPSKRKMEKEIRIAAPADVVWKALTDGEALTRWFPLDARVTPGKGGKIWMSWGPGFEGESKIEIWEPGRHLRKVQVPGATEEGSARTPLATDFYLEGEGGSTILRLVQSGFGEGSEWDDEYDSIDVGWGLYLKNLRHDLERHPGTPCDHRFELLPPPAMTREQAWSRIEAALHLPSTAGEAFARDYPGARIEGRMEVIARLSTIALVLSNYNDSLLRVVLCSMQGMCFASFDLYCFGVDRGRVDALTSAVRRLLEESLKTNP